MLEIKNGTCYINNDQYDGTSIDLTFNITPKNFNSELTKINEYFIAENYKELFRYLAERI